MTQTTPDAQMRAAYQKSLLRLGKVLPGNPRMEGVAAACNAVGLSPDTLYEMARRGETLPIEFREALYGPDVRLHERT